MLGRSGSATVERADDYIPGEKCGPKLALEETKLAGGHQERRDDAR